VNNGETLLMNPGDKISFHMSDAPAPGGGDAFEVVMDDLTTHQSGFMQASAANGFQTTSIGQLLRHAVQLPAGVQHGQVRQHQPVGRGLQVDISTEFETGHWEPCTSLSDQISPNPLDPSDTSGCTTSARARTRAPARRTARPRRDR
jgi:hypothetical protein